MTSITVDVAGERLVLLPQKAVYWPRERMLAIADIHFGKAAAFRSFGIPVPRGTTTENLDALDALIDATGAPVLIPEHGQGQRARRVQCAEDPEVHHPAPRLQVRLRLRLRLRTSLMSVFLVSSSLAHPLLLLSHALLPTAPRRHLLTPACTRASWAPR